MVKLTWAILRTSPSTTHKSPQFVQQKCQKNLNEKNDHNNDHKKPFKMNSKEDKMYNLVHK